MSAGAPWWLERVARLAAPVDLRDLPLGALWALREAAHLVRENVLPAELAEDVRRRTDAQVAWEGFVAREQALTAALAASQAVEQALVRRGGRQPPDFQAHWRGLGTQPYTARDGSAADDYLDALYSTSRLRYVSSEVPGAHVNLASRAARIADFLDVVRLRCDDVVFDLGSGAGKVALTVAASTDACVRGVELLDHATDDARASARSLGLGNVTFDCADVRDVELSSGSVFFLYHPFHGEVARAVAQALGRLAREKALTAYVIGPGFGFFEHFAREVDAGALRLDERRGEFGEVAVLRSAGSGSASSVLA